MVDLTSQQSVQPESLPGRAIPRIGEGPDSAAFGPGIARGVEAASDVVQRHVDAAQNQARQTQFSNGDNQAQALQEGLLRDPNNGAFTKQGQAAFDLQTQYLPQFDAGTQKILAATPDPQVRQQLQDQFARRRVELASQLDTHEITQHRKFADDTDTASMQLAQESSAGNYNDPSIIQHNRDKLDASIDSMAARQGWSDEQTQQARYEEHLKLNQGVLQAMLADKRTDMASAYLDHVRAELRPKDVAEAQQAIQAGQVDAAVQPIMAAYRLGTSAGEKSLAGLAQSGLTDEQQAEVIKEVQSQRAAFTYAQAQKYDQALTQLHTGIASGNPAPNAEAQANMLYEHGALSQQEHVGLLDTLARARNTQTVEDNRIGWAQQQFANGAKLDPKDKDSTEAMNLLFQQMTAGKAPGSPAYVNAATSIAQKTGVIPKDTISWARANLSGGDPQAAAAAASMLNRFQRENPTAYNYAVEDEQTRAIAHTINQAVSAGTDPKIAVALARDNANLSKAETQDLEDLWRNTRKKDPMTDDVKAVRSGFPGATQAQDVPLAMTSEFQDLTHEYFKHTGGNLQQAQQLALNDMRATWGLSQINGKPELMKWAPEAIFPGLTADMVRDDMLKVLGVTAPEKPASAMRSDLADLQATPGLANMGWLGQLRRPDGSVESEMPYKATIDGEERYIPLLVPTLTRPEVDTLLSVPKGESPPQAILDKAIKFARQRIGSHQPLSPEDTETPTGRDEALGDIYSWREQQAALHRFDVRLMESPKTAISGGMKWYIGRKDQFGAWDVARAENGMPLIYHLPDPSPLIAAAQARQDAEDMARLREKQEDLLAAREGVRQRVEAGQSGIGAR